MRREVRLVQTDDVASLGLLRCGEAGHEYGWSPMADVGCPRAQSVGYPSCTNVTGRMAARRPSRHAWRCLTAAAVIGAPLVVAQVGSGQAPAGAASGAGTYCGAINTAQIDGGRYIFQTDEWNSNQTQCVSTDGNADFTVTQSSIHNNTAAAPGSFPSIYEGCHWGYCTAGNDLPIRLSAMGDPSASWSTSQTGSGSYDVAFDLWFNQSPSTGGAPNAGELMVWLNSNGGVQPAGSPVAIVNIDGYRLQVWNGPGGDGPDTTYVIMGGTSSVSNLDLGNIIRDAESRGYLQASSYLLSVEAGFELWNGGAGLTTNSFSFSPRAPFVGAAPTADGNGYWEAAANGGVFSYGDAQFYGSMGATPLNRPVVGIGSTPDGRGYWEVASDGGVFAFGDAQFYGSTGGIHLNQPVVGIASTPDGKGYWEVATDGGVFAYGDAQFYGSMGGTPLNRPVVGIASTPDGKGYWEAASDGGVFAFGDARFYGSTGSIHLNQPVVGITRVPDGNGYWEVATDGGVFSFGDAQFYGSSAGTGQSVVDLFPAAGGAGYTLVDSDGTAAAF